MNMTKGSIRIFPKLKRGTVENGAQVCWLTTAEGRYHKCDNKEAKEEEANV